MSTTEQQTQSSAGAMAAAVANDSGIYGQYEIVRIRISPDNRKRFNEQALQELAESIKAVGVAQPILIRPVDPTPEAPEEFEIVAGERRYRASKIAGIPTIPALCRNLSNLEAAKLRILENLQREDPHPLEEAEGYQLLMMQHGFTADQLADEVKKSKAYVYGRLKLCALSPEARAPFLDNQISPSTALLIARIPVPHLQVRALGEILKPQWGGEPLSYRAAATHVQQRYMLDLTSAVFKIEDAKLLKSAGSCATCPKRAGNQPEVFEGISANVCTDPDCYAEKKAAHYAAITVQANKKGIPVHEDEEGAKLVSAADGWNKGCEFVHAGASLWHFDRNAPSTRNNGRVSDYLTDKTMPAVAAYAKNSAGDLVQLYKRIDIQAALEAVGACETEKARDDRIREAEADPSKASPADAKRAVENQKEAEFERKAAEITAFRVAVYTRIREHIAANGLNLQSLREITKLALQGELFLPTELNHLYGFNASQSQAWEAHIDQATMPEVQLLLIDAVLGFTLNVTSWEVKRNDVDDDDFSTVLDIATHEGIDYNQVREEMFPSPIDVSGVKGADLVDYLKPRLGRINEIKDAIVANRPELITALEHAANHLGYVWGGTAFQLQESKLGGAEQAEQDQQVSAADVTQSEDSAPVDLVDVVAPAAEPAAPAIKQRKTAKAKKATAAESAP